MRKVLLAASAALIAFSAPAFAQGRGGGGGGDRGGGASADVRGDLGGRGNIGGIGDRGGFPDVIPRSDNANERASGQVQGDVHAQTDVHASDRAHERTGASVEHLNAYGFPDRHGTDRDNKSDDTAASGAAAHVKTKSDTETKTPNYGGNVCPPGLADRTPACVPPGLANKTYRVGERLSGNFKYYTDLTAIPDTVKSQIPTQYQTSDYRYIYQTDRIYVVSDTTDKVVAVVNLTTP